jgi:hypothetical protein
VTDRRIRILFLGIQFCIFCVWFPTTPTLAADHVVTDNGDSGAGTLRQAISDANVGDTITFNLASGSETITLSSALSITKSLTIDGANAGSGTAVTVQADVTPDTASHRVLTMSAGTVTLENMTVRHGKVTRDPAEGGCIHSTASLTLAGVMVTECYATATENSASAAYGGIYSTSSLTLTNVTVSSNSVTGDDSFSLYDGDHADGCGIYSNGTANMADTTVSGNTATGGNEVLDVSTAGDAYGCGIYNVLGQTLFMTRANVVNNFADGGDAWVNVASGGSAYGGGVYDEGAAQITESTFSGKEPGGIDIFGISGYGGNAYGFGIFDNLCIS